MEKKVESQQQKQLDNTQEVSIFVRKKRQVREAINRLCECPEDVMKLEILCKILL